MTHWIIEKSQGCTDVGLLTISESVRTYTYLILSLQVSARSMMIGNMASAVTAQKAYLNNFENIVNLRVDIQEDIRRYQETLSCTSSKVDYSVKESIYMLPSDMNLNIKSGTVGYNDKILISDGMFSLGKSDKVNTTDMSSNNTTVTYAHKTSILHSPLKHTSGGITHEDEKITLILVLTSAFGIWYGFR